MRTEIFACNLQLISNQTVCNIHDYSDDDTCQRDVNKNVLLMKVCLHEMFAAMDAN